MTHWLLAVILMTVLYTFMVLVACLLVWYLHWAGIAIFACGLLLSMVLIGMGLRRGRRLHEKGRI